MNTAMKSPRYVIGIDVSKLTMDAALLSDHKIIANYKIENSESSLKNLLRQLREEHKCNKTNSLFCVENMGIYNTFLVSISEKRQLNLCLESPLRIKKSLGLQRGKNDKIDAERIAEYAEKNFSNLQMWKPMRPIIAHLKKLANLRDRLKKAKVMLSLSKKLDAYYLSRATNKQTIGYLALTLNAINDNVKRIEDEIISIIQADEKLNRLIEIITSVPSVKTVIATKIIIATNEFDPGWTAKGFACHCGIAPFERSSGASIKPKRVSGYADSHLKSLFHLAAMACTRTKNSFLRNYYQRKVAEGKPKMAVLNAVRNKLIHRIFACVRAGKLFVELPVAVNKE